MNKERIFERMQESKEPTKLEPHNVVPVAVTEDSSPERLALNAAQASAMAFMEASENNATIVASMLAIRRLYVVAYRELMLAVENHPEPLDDMTAEYLALSVVHKAAAPFDERELFVGVVESLVPWAAKTVEKHLEEDKAEQKAEKDARLEDYKTRKLNVGLLPHFESLDHWWDKNVSLVFVGWYKAVLYVLDLVTASILKQNGKYDPYCAIRMSDTRPSARIKDLLNLHIVAGSDWLGCCKSTKGLSNAIASVITQLSRRPDVLICDDLARSLPKPGWPRPDAAQAGDAHKVMRKFCFNNFMGFIGGISTYEHAVPDVTGTEYNQIRTFAQLVPLDVKEDGDHYKITVNRGGIVINAPKVEVDAYHRSVIAT